MWEEKKKDIFKGFFVANSLCFDKSNSLGALVGKSQRKVLVKFDLCQWHCIS